MAEKLPNNPATGRPSDMAGAILAGISDDRPSMGDPQFVDGRIRVMFERANHILASTAPDRQEQMVALAEQFAKEFRADNPDYIQTWSLASQDVFLKARGCGTDDTTPGDPVRALTAAMLRQFVESIGRFEDGTIDEPQLSFEIDATAEDFMMLLRGMDNPAD